VNLLSDHRIDPCVSDKHVFCHSTLRISHYFSTGVPEVPSRIIDATCSRARHSCANCQMPISSARDSSSSSSPPSSSTPLPSARLKSASASGVGRERHRLSMQSDEPSRVSGQKKLYRSFSSAAWSLRGGLPRHGVRRPSDRCWTMCSGLQGYYSVVRW
jgi:hypothetical protein